MRGSFFQRRTYAFHELIPSEKGAEVSLFDSPQARLQSDLGGAVFIPTPLKEYPLTHYLKITDADYEQFTLTESL